MRIKTGLSIILAIVAMAWFCSAASAAFVVTPMEFHVNVASNETGAYSFWVKNRGEETIALKVYVGDFLIQPDGKEAFLEPGAVERSCSKWVTVSPEEFELAPDESKAVRFEINVPPEKSGSYWGMVFIEQTNKPTIKTAQKGQQQFNILSFQRVGVRIYEDTPGSKPGEGKITQVTIGEGGKDEFLRVDLKMENNGDVILKGKGSIDIKDDKGENIESVVVNEFNCYPKSSRIVTTFVKDKLKAGHYSALAVIDYGADFLIAGEAVFDVGAFTGRISSPSPTVQAEAPVSEEKQETGKIEKPAVQPQGQPEPVVKKEKFENKVLKAITDTWLKITKSFSELFAGKAKK
ncbi:MAG: hypothetical protein Q8N76_05485 [Candidatus Omnitrophota bacterium]|nr:hypothetical protein [Candidatus Omnitrophota bacterium]